MKTIARWSFLLVLLVLALLGNWPTTIQAATTNWIAPGSGDWFTPSNWDQGTPDASVLAQIDNAGTANIATGSATALQLTLAATNSGNVLQTGGSMTFSSGNSGLAMATGASSSGRYEIRDGSLSVFRTFSVGVQGTGAFFQSGGHVSLTSSPMQLAEGNGSSGSYQLSGGLLDANDMFSVGLNGSGQFTQAGGQANIKNLRIADAPHSTGVFQLQGGTLVTTTTGLGNGDGSFVQTAGSHISSSLSIPFGQNGSHTASYSLSGNSSVLHVTDEAIGSQGNGKFIQASGSHTVDSYLQMGFDTGVASSYVLQSGSLSTGYEIIGVAAPASFVQFDGTHVVQHDMTIGAGGSPGFTAGDFSLQGGSLSVLGDEMIAPGYGNGGTGALHLKQGTHHVVGNLSLAKDVSGKGLVELLDGTLQLDGSLLLQENLGAHATFRTVGGLGSAKINGDLIMGPSNRVDQKPILDEIIEPSGLAALTLDGTAKLNGILNVTVDHGVILFPGEQFTVLRAAHGVQGGMILQGPDAAKFRMDILPDRVLLTSLVPEPSSLIQVLIGLAIVLTVVMLRESCPRLKFYR